QTGLTRDLATEEASDRARMSRAGSRYPAPSAVLELFKPITWFPPMWAYMCGVISSGAALGVNWTSALLGVALAGPLVCATSQAANDWYDRHVDALNEPNRPIPSGRIPGSWGFYIAVIWSGVSLAVGAMLGNAVLAATVFGLVLAWAYSAPPLRLKQNGWYGNAAVGLCYEGLPWFTGAAAMIGAVPDTRIIVIALLYSVGAHGIMTLNDFKSINGDRKIGIRSLPAQLGTANAARLACLVMTIPQVIVIALLTKWGAGWTAAIVTLLLVAQLICMRHMLARPFERAPWYNATGTTLYVLGMLASAIALRIITGGS
ncbi:MAG: chlorophyll synthase ChlG, partial [Pseudomonadota bacterium]